MAVLADDLRRTSRWPVLDGVRGAAVLAVVGYHAANLTVGVDSWATAPLALGRFGVDAFFVLSGFLIVTAWDRRPELTPFAWRRVRRLWPAYLVSVVVLVPLLAPDLLGDPGGLVLLVLLQGYLADGLTTSVNVPWWSLTTEVHFYLVVPLLAPLLHRPRLRWLLLAASAALAVWWVEVGAAAVGLAPSLLPGRLSQFLAGALAGLLVRERGAAVLTWAGPASPWVGRLALTVTVAAGLLAVADVLVPISVVVPVLGAGLGLFLLHAVVRTEQGHRSALTHPVLRGAGLVSYSLYLWHFPILLATARWAEVADHPERIAPAVAVGLAGTALATAVSYRWVERPLLHGRSRVPDTGRSAPVEAPPLSRPDPPVPAATGPDPRSAVR